MGAPPIQLGEEEALPVGPPSRLPHTFRALRHRNFRLFIGGQIISLVGTWMQNAAQSWLVFRLTHNELLLGTTWFCSTYATEGSAARRFAARSDSRTSKPRSAAW